MLFEVKVWSIQDSSCPPLSILEQVPSLSYLLNFTANNGLLTELSELWVFSEGGRPEHWHLQLLLQLPNRAPSIRNMKPRSLPPPYFFTIRHRQLGKRTLGAGCVRVRVCARMHACVHVRACRCEWLCVREFVCVCREGVWMEDKVRLPGQWCQRFPRTPFLGQDCAEVKRCGLQNEKAYQVFSWRGKMKLQGPFLPTSGEPRNGLPKLLRPCAHGPLARTLTSAFWDVCPPSARRS